MLTQTITVYHKRINEHLLRGNKSQRIATGIAKFVLEKNFRAARTVKSFHGVRLFKNQVWAMC